MTDLVELGTVAARGEAVEVDEVWCHDGGVFGGFIAGLGLAACAAALDLPTMVSAYVSFLVPMRPGPAHVTVEPLRRGTTNGAAHARVLQEGALCAIANAWLTAAPLPGDGPARDLGVPGPADCERIRCWDEGFPFLRMLEERAIDYPVTVADFPGGPPVADLWAREIKGHPDGTPLASQMVDVILCDAHLLDAAVRALPVLELNGVSLDLTISWASVAGDGGRRVRTEAAGTGRGLVTMQGTVWDAGGAVVARASQLALVRS